MGCCDTCSPSRVSIIITRIEVPLLIIAGVLGLIFTVLIEVFIPVLLIGILGLFHPFFLPQLYQRLPNWLGHRWQKCKICGQFAISSLMLIINAALGSLLFGGWANTIIIFNSYGVGDDSETSSDNAAIATLTFLVLTVCTLPLMAVNLYALCIMYKHRSFSIYDVKFDVEEPYLREETPTVT